MRLLKNVVVLYWWTVMLPWRSGGNYEVIRSENTYVRVTAGANKCASMVRTST